ncbi:MAG: hypothetical protein LC687_01915, partial [Actinobacteria bacterium]|nr:hypothetical protein [Actinomycetota bacterium]
AQTEQVIDGIYAWLDGITEQPEFVIDFGPARERFAEELAVYATERLQALPTCASLDQLPGEIDLLTVECLPPGFDPMEETSTYTDELLASDEFIPEVGFSSAELLENIEDPDGKMSSIPNGFQWLVRSVWVIAGVIVALSLGLFTLASTKRIGIRRVGIQFFVAGLWLGFSTLIVWLLQDGLFQNNIMTTELQNAFIRAGELLVGEILLIMAFGAGLYVFIGLVLRFVLTRMFHEKPNDDITQHTNKE